MYKIMTPGPTQVPATVRNARAKETTNPDIDTEFCEFYHSLCKRIGRLLHTENEVYLLSGEGILGLEAACASLTEPGDSVLVIDNGIFGKGFADFVTIYGGEPTIFTTDYHQPVPLEELREYLKEHHDYKYATVVHCDTPSGVLNDVEAICCLLKEYGILTVVDSVSAMFGEPIDVDAGQMDIVCGGSQKAMSAPPGLTFVTVSEGAKQVMRKRKVPIASFYCNLLTFDTYYEDKWFPYTMPISDIYGLEAAVTVIEQDPFRLERHQKLAKYVRETLTNAGLSLYLTSGYSATVTVVNVPKETTSDAILETMKEEHGILIAGCFDILAGKVIRIGHMGANANEEDVHRTMQALGDTMKKLGVPLLSELK